MQTGFAEILIGCMLPFLGTSLGAAVVYLGKNTVGETTKNCLSSFAAGIMTAASFWSLLKPAVDFAEIRGCSKTIPCLTGFCGGIIFICVTDGIAKKCLLINKSTNKLFTIAFSVTLHNIPEGMAVGASMAGLLAGEGTVDLTSAISLSIGIALQNIPEGAVISAPLFANGKSKNKAFLYGVLSGAVEPIGAAFTLCWASRIIPAMSFLLAFAAGAMIYAVFSELTPSKEESKLGAICSCIGFALMMGLDISLG